MKQFLLILLFISAGVVVKAQQAQKDIEEQFLKYTHLLIEKKFKESTGYVIEDFFTIIPKETLIEVMEKTFNDPNLSFAIDSPKVISISQSKTIKGKQYAKLQYSNIIHMKMNVGQSDAVLPDSAQLEFMTLALQGQFGEDNVKFNKEKNTYSIYAKKDAIAQTTDNKNWKFIVVEEKQLPLLKKIIPKELLEQSQ